MSAVLLSIQGGISQGVLWGIMALGVYITFRVLDIADLTVDGSFALGGCVCAILIAGKGWNPVLALAVAALAGALAGAVTGFLHTVCEIPAILAGILTQLGSYSVCYRLMENKSNISLLQSESIFAWLVGATGWKQSAASMVLGILIIVVTIVLLYWFFGTEIGAAVRATGSNENMMRAQGVNTNRTKVLGLAVSNGLVGLSGGLVAQSQKYGDIQMGVGAIVIGLASIVIGEMLLMLLARQSAFGTRLTAIIIGAAAYFVIRALVLRIAFVQPTDMKLISALIVALALSIPVFLRKARVRRMCAEGGGKSC